jgi:hypothetical protein
LCGLHFTHDITTLLMSCDHHGLHRPGHHHTHLPPTPQPLLPPSSHKTANVTHLTHQCSPRQLSRTRPPHPPQLSPSLTTVTVHHQHALQHTHHHHHSPLSLFTINTPSNTHLTTITPRCCSVMTLVLVAYFLPRGSTLPPTLPPPLLATAPPCCDCAATSCTWLDTAEFSEALTRLGPSRSERRSRTCRECAC